MKKCLVLSWVFLIMVPFLVACDESNQRIVMANNVLDEEKGGWEFRQKEITEQSDVDKILSELESLNLTTESEDQNIRVGGAFMILYTDKKGNEFNYKFEGRTINKNGTYYDIEQGVWKGLFDLYDLLDYEEIRWPNK